MQAGKHFGLPVKCPLLLASFKQKSNMPTNFSKTLHIKFYKNLPSREMNKAAFLQRCLFLQKTCEAKYELVEEIFNPNISEFSSDAAS
jgi:hypothetical protein